MNATEYINSGAIEACIMGVADEQALQLLEQMEASYPEVKAAREAKQQFFEQAALQQHSAASNLQIQEAEQNGRQAEELQDEQILPGANAAKPGPLPAEVAQNKKKPQLPPAPKPIRWFRTALATSVLLLMGSVLVNFYYYSEYTDTESRYEELLAQQNKLLARSNAMEASLATMMSPRVKPLLLSGLPSQPSLRATVYWNQETGVVYLLANNLPAPPSGKQYQLWAQVNGQLKDAGVITLPASGLLIKMKTIPQAEAFAISLENVGESPISKPADVILTGKI